MTLVRNKRAIVCVGCGGVGKTTTTAALGVLAAREGLRVLCLTIDPSRRLLQSLGVDTQEKGIISIAPERLAAAGVRTGTLSVMRLDAKRTFDELIGHLASTDERRKKIMAHPLYDYITGSLAGTQEYMAMERLYALWDRDDVDLILLDTPPTSHALDFLEAPERLTAAIDSPATRWFVQAMGDGQGFGLNWVTKGAAKVLSAVGKLTGSGFLEQISTLLAEINEIFGGWKDRAERVYRLLRSEQVAFVLVSSPDRHALSEVGFFADQLRRTGAGPQALIINRAPIEPVAPSSVAGMAPDLAMRVALAVQYEGQWASLDGTQAKDFPESLRGVPQLRIPTLGAQVTTIEGLGEVATKLAGASLH